MRRENGLEPLYGVLQPSPNHPVKKFINVAVFYIFKMPAGNSNSNTFFVNRFFG